MGRAEVLQGVRQMRFEALLDRRERGQLNQEEAGEMRGISERTFRGWRDRPAVRGRTFVLREPDTAAMAAQPVRVSSVADS